MDIQIIIDAYKKYAKYKDKNLIQLMEFSKLARVEEKVRRYMEVLLWINLISSILEKWLSILDKCKITYYNIIVS